MKAKQKPAPGQNWVAHTFELKSSDAWRSQLINTRRFVDFLEVEHLRKGGRENGKLKAPRRQLEAYGIGSHFVTDAIEQAEALGLVRAERGGMRVATTYALTYLPMPDGTPPTNEWRAYIKPGLTPEKSRNLNANQQSGLGAKQQSDAPKLTAKRQSDSPKSLGAKQQHLSINSYQDGGYLSVSVVAPDGQPA